MNTGLLGVRREVAALRRMVQTAQADRARATPNAAGAPADLLAWTEACRVLGGRPLRPTALPWLRDLYAATAPEIYVMKASQVFCTEWLISTALWVADTGYAERGNALYVFPTQTALDDLVQARVDPALDASPHLLARVGAARYGGKVGVERVRLKRVGAGHVYFRGSDRRRQLLSIDADVLCLDEVDEFRPGTIAVARQRLASSRAPLIRGASTPKYPASGMGLVCQQTTRRRYFLRCDACAARQPLQFPDNLRPDGTLVCAHCGARLDPRAEGEWVAEAPDAAVEGYHVSRLYSPRADLPDLATLGYGILEGKVSDPSVIQEFHNQALGEPFAPAGGALTDDILLACCAAYSMPAPATTAPVVMGVDVGSVLHCYIKAPAADGGADATRALSIGTVPSFEELDRLMTRYQVAFCVIDAEPEAHKTAEFAARFPGRVARCFYPNISQWKHEAAFVWNRDERVMLAHRTRALDACFDRFYQRLEQLPQEAPHLPGLFAQLKAPTRLLVQDARGQTVARYDERSVPDHYPHAANYCELARTCWAGQQLGPVGVWFIDTPFSDANYADSW